MPPAMPELDGVEHSYHDLPTGVRVHVAAAGPLDAPPLLLLHGWPQHWWSWRHVIAELAAEFRILCPDLRGLGWSGQPDDDDFRKQRLGADAIALLDALGIERARVAGHDWGAWAAMYAALDAPTRVSSLLALSIGHPWVSRLTAARHGWLLAYQVPLAAPFVGERLIREGRYPRGMLNNGRRNGTEWTEAEIETYLAPLREPAVAHASSKLYRDFMLRELPPSAAGAFSRRRFAMPAHLVIGSREPFRALTADWPGVRAVIEGAGHFVPEEDPQAVAEHIRAM